MLNPIVILIIGVALLIAMMLVLRLNAFVALITSAMIVSLLSPGEFADKITRVGQAFGVTRERIRQIEAKALRKLRHPIRSRKLRDYLNE